MVHSRYPSCATSGRITRIREMLDTFDLMQQILERYANANKS
jgi:hypothetical protein